MDDMVASTDDEGDGTLTISKIRGRDNVLGIVTEIRHEGRRNFRDQRTNVQKELCTLSVD